MKSGRQPRTNAAAAERITLAQATGIEAKPGTCRQHRRLTTKCESRATSRRLLNQPRSTEPRPQRLALLDLTFNEETAGSSA